MLTDDEIKWAAEGFCPSLPDMPLAGERRDVQQSFRAGARFARDRYEARLAEDAKVRAQLVASLQNLVAAICKVQDWDGTRVGSALDDVDAALAAAKERG